MFISNGWILQDIPRTTTRTSDIPLFVFGIDRNVYQSYFLTPFKLRLKWGHEMVERLSMRKTQPVSRFQIPDESSYD